MVTMARAALAAAGLLAPPGPGLWVPDGGSGRGSVVGRLMTRYVRDHRPGPRGQVQRRKRSAQLGGDYHRRWRTPLIVHARVGQHGAASPPDDLRAHRARCP